MSTTPTLDALWRGYTASECGVARFRRLLALLLILGNGGCHTPSLLDLQRHTAEAAEGRARASTGSTRIREELEVHTAPEADSLVQGELDETAVARVALINNPGLAAEYANLGIARSALVRAARLSNPELEASARYGDAHNETVDIKALQDIVDLALLPRRREAATRSLDAAQERLTSRIMGVAHQARSAFVDYQAAVVLLAKTQERLACREAAMDVARRMVEAGNMTSLDLASFLQRYHANQLELTALHVDWRNKREAVNRVMGLHEDTNWKAKAAGDIIDEAMGVPKAGAERSALDASLELSAQRSDIEALGRQRGITQTKSYLPEIKVGVDSERDSEGSWAVGPALVLTVPLFNQGQAMVAAVDAHMQASWNRYAQNAVAIASATRTAVGRTALAHQALRTQQEDMVPLCKNVLKETLLEYNGMLVGVFDLLLAKERVIESEVHEAELIRDYRLACLVLQHLLAGGEPADNPDLASGASIYGDSGKDAH